MYKKYGRRPRKFYRKRKTGIRRPRTKVATAVRRFVKKAIHRNLENKVYITYGANQSITTASGTTPTNVYCLPPLSQGTGHSGRVGNEVKMTKGYIKGYVNILPYNSSTNPLNTPVYVKMWLCSCKLVNNPTLSSSTIASDFFETNNTSNGFTGNMIDLCLTNNKDNWVIYKTKTLKIGATYTAGGLNNVVNSAGYLDNSHMSLPFYFSFGQHFKSILKYNDTGNANYPTNRNLFLVFQAVNADGSTSAVTSAEYHYSIRIEYEDA